MRRFFLSFLLIGFLARAEMKTSFQCSRPELQRRECRLKAMNYDIYFNWEKVRLNNGVWRAIVEIPGAQKKSQWKKVRFFSLSQRYFIELLVWDEPRGGAQVSSLNWHLLEVTGVRARPLFSKVVQKRRSVLGEPGQFYYDRIEKFGLRTVERSKTKKSKLRWYLGHQSGEF